MKKFAMALVTGTLIAGTALAAPPPAEFVRKAGASDLYEITSSKLVMASANPKVKQFATQMVADHTKSTADVKAAAMKAGLTPKPPMLEPKQASDVAALKAARGPARDMLYIQQQKVAHQQALALHKDNAATSTAPALKAVSARIVPVVEHHAMELGSM